MSTAKYIRDSMGKNSKAYHVTVASVVVDSQQNTDPGSDCQLASHTPAILVSIASYNSTV